MRAIGWRSTQMEFPEMMNASEDQFGVDRLKQFVEEQTESSALGFIDRLLEHVASWSGRATGEEPEDDLTLLAVHFKAGS